jgi:protein-glucosylgalactosylhydroxylysine glucosidase
MDKELTILYLTLLDREPSTSEKTEYLYNLNIGYVTLDEIERNIKQTIEYKKYREAYGGTVVYDRQLYRIDVSDLNESNYDGVNIANGKICVKSGAKPYETSMSIITVNYDFDNMGRYNNNVVSGFKYTDIRFCRYEQETIKIEDYKQYLNMYNATFTKSYKVVNELNEEVYVTHEFMALQQYPYCFFQRCSIENRSETPIDMSVYHMLSHEDNLLECEFFNNIIDGMYMFSGKGNDKDKRIVMYTNSGYLLGTGMQVRGYESRSSTSVSNKIDMRIEGSSTNVLGIVSGMMSTSDFGDPERELTRILLNIRNKELKVEHNKKWIDIWNTADIHISQKTNINTDDLDDANKEVGIFQRNLKYSLYNVFSMVRDDVNVEVNTLNLSAIDVNGEIFWNAEMYLIPVLIMMRPMCAKVLLNFRYKQLENAKNLAIAYGNKGGQYPYKGDIMYYKDVYWDSSSPVYAFNTGLIAINVWNYYRVTQDKYWLHEKGFLILQNSARFFQSLFMDDNENMKEVYTINNNLETNNVWTKYLAINVLKHYKEACHELSFNIPSDINELYKSVVGDITNITQSANVDIGVDIPTRVRVGTDGKDLIFYDADTVALIGKQFGGNSGKHMRVSIGTDYEFIIDKDTFVKFYDTQNVEITEYEGSALYSSEYGLTEGTVVVRDGDIESYSNLYKKDYIFGKKAFVKTSVVTLHNVINSNVSNTILESHFILMTYYSKLFFNRLNILNKADVIQDNLMYYNILNANVEKTMNQYIIGNLECLLAQDIGLNTSKEYYINKFDQRMQDLFKSEVYSAPWGNNTNYALFVFNILTSMVKIRIRGEISDQKFYITTFGVDTRSGNILPKYWSKIDVKYNKKTVTIHNSI